MLQGFKMKSWVAQDTQAMAPWCGFPSSREGVLCVKTSVSCPPGKMTEMDCNAKPKNQNPLKGF